MLYFKSQKGQTTLETIVVGMGFLTFLSFVLCIFYLGSVYTNLRFTSHEFLLCPEYQYSQICLQNFQHSLNQFVRFGTIQNLQFINRASQREVSFQLKLRILNLKNVDFNYQDQIVLPLKAI